MTSQELEPGGELDFAVAEAIGLKTFRVTATEDWDDTVPEGTDIILQGAGCQWWEPNTRTRFFAPSRTSADAFYVFQRLGETFGIVTIEQWICTSETVYRVRATSLPWEKCRGLNEGSAPTMPLAVCRCAIASARRPT